jgi:hypothetical protein
MFLVVPGPPRILVTPLLIILSDEPEEEVELRLEFEDE